MHKMLNLHINATLKKWNRKTRQLQLPGFLLSLRTILNFCLRALYHMKNLFSIFPTKNLFFGAQRKKNKRNTDCSMFLSKKKCRRPESNRYDRLGSQDFKSCASASSATPAEWMEKDSNLRSRRQQIYSLPPLATRESIHNCPNSNTIYHTSHKNASVFYFRNQFFTFSLLKEFHCMVS